MKRLTNIEKKNLGILIHYYRNMFFRSDNENAQSFKQVNFCKDICSQAQLSRLENGEPLKNQEIYEKFLNKLNLSYENVSTKEYLIFETYIDNILISQNDDNLLINYNEYVLIINKYQNIFKKNIIYTHYNYVLEFIINILGNDIEDANYIIEDIENNLDILSPKLLILALQYLGRFYHIKQDYYKATKYYLLSITNMDKYNIENPIIYLDIAYNYIKKYQYLYAFDYLNKALHLFINSDNLLTISKIYEYYGMIYLYNKYYDEGINYLIKSLEYCKKVKKSNIEKKVKRLLAVAFYFKNENKKAIEILKEIIDNDESKLLCFIINNDQSCKEIKDDKYYLVAKLYMLNINKEIHFENEIKPILDQLSDEIRLLIIHDIFIHYIKINKYKKVLELIEDYII